MRVTIPTGATSAIGSIEAFKNWLIGFDCSRAAGRGKLIVLCQLRFGGADLQPAICLKRYLMVCNKMSAMLRDYYKVRFPLEKNFLVVYDEPANEGGQDMFPVQLRERHATVSGSRSI